jgi:hypothetical protein
LSGVVANEGPSVDAAFTMLAYAATELKSTFNYYEVFDTAAKINFVVGVRIGGKADCERLFWL